jgi:DNA-binding FadR family transcriptional regulator
MYPRLFRPFEDKKSLSVIVASKIEEAICQKVLSQHEKLPSVNNLSKQFDVSASIVREALRILHGKGLVISQKGKGVFVNAPDSTNVSEIMNQFLFQINPAYNTNEMMAIREMIVPSLAERAAYNRTESQFKKFSDNLFSTRQYANWQGICLLDMEFHLLLAEIGGNELIKLVMVPLEKMIYESNLKNNQLSRSYIFNLVSYHDQLVSAIERQDGKAAYTIVKEFYRREKESVHHELERPQFAMCN